MRACRPGRWTIVPALIACALYASTSEATPPQDQPSWSSKRVIVKFRQDIVQRAALKDNGQKAAAATGDAILAATQRVSTIAHHWGVTKIRRAYPYEFRYPELAARYGLDRTYIMTVPTGTDAKSMAAAIAVCSDEVETAAVDPIGRPSLDPDDTLFDQQYALSKIMAPEAWDLDTGDVGTVTIAIIDSGLNTGVDEHPEFSGRILPGINAAEMGTANEDVTSDATGHGTHVAGIAAAEGNNAEGIAGVTWGAYLLPVRVWPVDPGLPTASDVGNGLIWAAQQSADICNLSLEFYVDSAGQSAINYLESAVGYAYDSGALLVAASGNGSETHPAYPARFSKCMAVTATDSNDAIYLLANDGCELDVAAPGVAVLSTFTSPQYKELNGTSMASPHVAGLAALMKSYNPALTNRQMRDITNATADDLGTAGWDGLFGYGRINAFHAMQAAIPSLAVASSTPPSGAIDARIPVDPDGSNPHGWQDVEFTFDGDASAVAPEDFVVTRTRSNVACVEAGPLTASVTPDPTESEKIVLALEEQLEPKTWTKIIYRGSGDGICLGALPGDVSGNRSTNRDDLTAMINCLKSGPGACQPWSCDTDRLGSCTAADLAVLVDLLNGSAAYGSWNTATVGLSPCNP